MSGRASGRAERTARNLVAMALAQTGKPEGHIARAKLARLISRHPQLANYAPVVALAKADLGLAQRRQRLTLADVGKMRRAGIDVTGRWTGANLDDAIRKAVDDLAERLANDIAQRMSEAALNLEELNAALPQANADVASMGNANAGRPSAP